MSVREFAMKPVKCLPEKQSSEIIIFDDNAKEEMTDDIQEIQSESNEPEENYDNEVISEDDYEEETNEDSYKTQNDLGEGFDSSFKAYMDYRCITDTNSVQYSLQEQAYTDSRGFRKIGDDYCVALGTGYTSGCGERFMIYLDSGFCFSAIVADIKSDMHTDATNCFVPSGSNSGNIVEFIIDSECAESEMLSSGNAGYYDDLSGNIISIEPI